MGWTSSDEPKGRRVLVTGASGVVGSSIVDLLEKRNDVSLTAASARGRRARGIVAWDQSHRACPPELRKRWDVIIHCGASTRWTMTKEQALENVAALGALRGLVDSNTHLVHISTAFADSCHGDVESEDAADYANLYEWSKAASERLAHTFPNVSIVRPPLIIGSRRDGSIVRFNGIYTLLQALTAGLLPAMVGDRDAFLEMAPVDDVAETIVRVALDSPVDRTITIGRGTRATTVGQAVDLAVESLNAWRLEHGASPLDAPPFVTLERWERFFRPFILQHVGARYRQAIKLLESFMPYLSIHRPMEIDAEIADLALPLQRSVRWWAEQRSVRAKATPRPWSGVADVTTATQRNAVVTRQP